MMTDVPPSPQIINLLFDAVYPSFAMLAGIKLDIFSILADSPRNAQEIADLLNVQMTKLRPLLYALVSTDLLIVKDDYFANTPESDHYLVKGKPDYMGSMANLTGTNWSKMLNMTEVILGANKLEKYDYQAMPEDELISFLRGLSPHAIADAHRLMEHYDFSTHQNLLDVGGGSGSLAITITNAHSQIEATIFDLPSVTPVTEKFIQEAQMTEHITVLSGDAIHDKIPGTFDVVIARHLIQVLSATDSQNLLKNLASTTKPGGFIHLIGWILDNSRLTPTSIVNNNLILLSGYADGQAYTEDEYYEWLNNAGFSSFERKVFTDGSSIITAQKQS